MKKITIVVASLFLLATNVYANDVQTRSHESNYAPSTHFESGSYAAACTLEYEITDFGWVIFGLGIGSGGLSCTGVDGQKVEFPVEQKVLNIGPQLGLHYRAGWMMFAAVGVGQAAERWKAATVGVQAAAAVGLSLAVHVSGGADNRGSIGAAFGAEVGAGIGVGLTLRLASITQVEEFETDTPTQQN